MPLQTVSLLQGTLDLLILRTLRTSPMHGHGISKAIRKSSDEMVLVEHGSLYPALHRMEKRGWVKSAWEATPSGRPMKFYSLTEDGVRQLEVEQSKWEQLAWAIGLVLRQA